MSWLSKVSDIAGAAENLLNKLDEKTGDAIQQARDTNKPRTRQGSTASIPATVISMPEHVITEDFGRPAPSIPSRAQSDYTGAGWRGRGFEQSSSSQQPGGGAAASESWTMVLNSKEVKSAQREDDMRSVGGRSVASMRTTSEFAGTDSSPNFKSQLFVKDSQISVLKTKLAESERKLEKRSQDYYEMKAEKEMLEKRVENQKVSSQEMDSLQELKLARQKAQDQKDKAVEECNLHKRKIVGLEEEIRAMVEQLRLAKFNLNENKKEFDEYKNKAQKILTAKEKLVESLKSEQGIGSSDRPVHLLQAEVEEIRVERDLTKADLESAQLQVYTLRSDMEELEAHIRASGYGSTISRHQRILRFFWHPDIWGYIKGIWIWEYHIKASEDLAILLASGYMGIYQGHLDMGVPYQGIIGSCDSSGIRIYGDISWASGYGSTISRHQRILRFFWHPDIWGYIMGIWIWEYHIKASENLAILLASGYMGIYHGHLGMGVPYQGIRESCDSSGIRIYGDISWASGYGSTISRHQRILRFFWHPDIWGYIMGIWVWEYHIKASENLAILLASGYMGIYHGHLDMGVPYQGIRESCDSSGIRIYGDISWASGYGSTISRHQRILRFFWHPDIWGYIMGIWVWEYHIKASENLAILLASGYMGIYHGHLGMGVPYQGIRESCDSSGIRRYRDISWASGYGSTISRHQRILRFLWHPEI
ncbi:hypothetical protein B9Z55_000204 [Caenorhabditis nigoni]|uniref:Uncharacterized protein n=2 Tax=Caenorhabditis nigoni TaxID=1611254 RepID=A0A2G5VIT3_9PELO|nr:hypothetical protein B9Z55_000204 [Caenorhabditis nigoni]